MSLLVPSSRWAALPGWALDVAIGAITVSVVAALLFGWPPLSRATASLTPSAGSRAPAAQLSTAGIPSDDTIQLLTGNALRSVATNGEIPLGDSLFGRIAVSHSNEGPLRRNLDVFVYQNPTAAQTVGGANVKAVANMFGMSKMGTLTQMGAPAGAGHYLISLDFPMSGQWQIDLSVDAATEHATTSLLLYVWR